VSSLHSPFGRAIVIVMDSVGIGELPDASAYGDEGSNTVGNIAKWIKADHMTQAAHRRYDNRAGRERNRQDLWIGVSYDLLMASSISGKLGLV